MADETYPQELRYHKEHDWVRIDGEDAVFGLGFTPTSRRRSFGPSTTSFGHFGTGGAVGFCDPENRIALGYVMNHVIPRWQSSRNRAIIDALSSSLATLNRT